MLIFSQTSADIDMHPLLYCTLLLDLFIAFLKAHPAEEPAANNMFNIVLRPKLCLSCQKHVLCRTQLLDSPLLMYDTTRASLL